MKTFHLSSGHSCLTITEAECEEGIILKIDKNVFKDSNCFHVRVFISDEHEKEPLERDTIPGHPNCHVGECIDCHNVSCAIYQGYEDMP